MLAPKWGVQTTFFDPAISPEALDALIRPNTRVLYLEHSLLGDVFSEQRRKVLKWLTAQAAISIENAELYGNLEQQVAEARWAMAPCGRRWT